MTPDEFNRRIKQLTVEAPDEWGTYVRFTNGFENGVSRADIASPKTPQ